MVAIVKLELLVMGTYWFVCSFFREVEIEPVMRLERCSDDESDSYPWVGYQRVIDPSWGCLALVSWISACAVPY